MDELIGLDFGHGENTWEEKHSKGVVVNGVAYEEHHFNARVGMKTKKLLEHNGFRTFMAQQPYANEVSLDQRIKEYNAQLIKLGFSFHANAASPTAKGLCAFYWNSSPEGKKAAEIYARLVKDYGYPQYSDGTEPSRLNHWTNFAMLRDTKAVWLLTENGFMTNPDDFKLIFKSPKYEDHLAEIHTKIACEYFGRAFKPLTIAVPAAQPVAYTDKVTVSNTAYWQAQILVKEYQKRGFKCYLLPLKQFVEQNEKDPCPFVVETDFSRANVVKMELEKKGYKAVWEAL